MPNFDCGAYFLSTLIPVKTSPMADPTTGAPSSPVHLMRAKLAKLAPARQSLFCNEDSPFAKNTRNHFVRLVIIEDLAYVGRKRIPALLTVATELLLPPKHHINPVTAQKQDHLTCPFLFFSADFDAASGDDSERDAYLKGLWESAGAELRDIFRYCERFDEVGDAESFARYIAKCQVKTTMPFHDYFLDGVPLDALPEMQMKTLLGILFGVAALVFTLLHVLLWPSPGCFALLIKALIALAAGVLTDYVIVTRGGEKPFPPAPGSTLPDVLKSLYLKEQFTRFAIANQRAAAGRDEVSARRLQAAFKEFAATSRPQDNAAPTQAPGWSGV